MEDTNMNREARVERDTLVVIGDGARRRRTLIIGASLMLVALAIAFFFFSRGDSGDAATKGAAAAPGAAGAGGPGGRGQVPAVSVIVPGRSSIARVVTASGALAAQRDQPIGAAGGGGRVTAVLVDAGSWVRQGQTLVTVDRSVQAEQTAQLAAAVESARANAALAQNEYDRSATLVGRGFVSKADLDRKRAARDQARAQVRVAQAQLGATRAGIGLLDVRAPNNGLILSRSVEVGQVIGGASGALFRLARDGAMEMRAQLSQGDLASMRVGLPASVRPLGSDVPLSGTVRRVSPVIDPVSRQGEVLISVPYTPAIRPGGFAEARITAGATTAPLLPQSAVLSDADGNYVYVINGRKEVERRRIKVGAVDNSGVVVTEGLSGNETVVLSAGPFLNPGQKVAPRLQAAR
jgi:RND family efflux transporter MFP subunit